MEDEETTDEASGQTAPAGDASVEGGGGLTRELVLMRAGGLAFAVFADEVEATGEGLRPTPLPHAPASVLGVVCVRGRVRTVLYPPALLDEDEAGEDENVTTAAPAPRFVVALRGDEQLALAADQVERVAFTQPADFPTPRAEGGVVRGALRQGGTDVLLLDPAALFDAAMRRRERRRQRVL